MGIFLQFEALMKSTVWVPLAKMAGQAHNKKQSYCTLKAHHHHHHDSHRHHHWVQIGVQAVHGVVAPVRNAWHCLTLTKSSGHFFCH